MIGSFVCLNSAAILEILCLFFIDEAASNGYANGMVSHCFGYGEVFIHIHFSVKGEAVLGLGLVVRLRLIQTP